MTQKVKLICYVLLAIIGVWCGVNFVRAYSKTTGPRPVETTVEPGDATTPTPATTQKGRNSGNVMGYAAGLFAVLLCGGLLMLRRRRRST